MIVTVVKRLRDIIIKFFRFNNDTVQSYMFDNSKFLKNEMKKIENLAENLIHRR